MEKKSYLYLVTGRLQKHRRGFGFVLMEDDVRGDVYIPASSMEGAMNGDLVKAGVERDDADAGRREGRVVRILERAVTEIVGTFERARQFGFVVPDDRRMTEDIFVLKKHFNGAEKGDKVVVRITQYPDHANNAQGEIVEVISRAGEAGGDIRALVRQFGFEPRFSQAAADEAAGISKTVEEQSPLRRGRRDLRQETIFTIDGSDSKDFDDAVSIRRMINGNFLLGVHIADVSAYVAEKSPLDREAFLRGTSVYLLDQVIPMLPPALSDGICSLNEGVDRLALSIDMEVDADGRVVHHDLYESVIRSAARLTYTEVSDFLEEKEKDGLRVRHPQVCPALDEMRQLAAILHEARQRRGSIDFDLEEARIELDDSGIPIQISLAERRIANRLIEEFMLLANETVAWRFSQSGMPFVYRIHEKPDPDKIQAFQIFLGGFGLTLNGRPDSVPPAAFNGLLQEIKGRPEEHVISTVMLRSMQKAFYGTECSGHFGLALKHYCHFTSPIRRYPDLIIHRIIRESLRGPISERRQADLRSRMEAAADQSSVMERRALELEREVEKLKKAEFMAAHIGETFEAVISGVTGFGFFAELENTVEGLVRMEDLTDDYYDFEPDQYRLRGRRTNRVWSLGDRVTIVVRAVDVESREIDFAVQEAED